jgi:PAS domain S-box-containing protein
MLGPAGSSGAANEVVDLLEDPRRGLLRRLAAGEPTPALLAYLVATLEARAPGLIASVLLVEQGRLKYGAAPNLPEGYNRAADNHPIGEGFGACGTSAFRRTMVIVEDTQIDPLWRNYREIARRYGLGACWSLPIKDPAGEVMGTIALYSHKPRRPRPDELALIEEFGELGAVVLQRHRRNQALDERDRRFRELVEDVDAVVWEAPANLARFDRVSTRVEQMFGHPQARWLEPGFWQSVLHPDDRAAVLERHKQAPLASDNYELHYRVCKPDGAVVWVRESVRVQRDVEARPQRLRGVMVDISRQREAEEVRERLEHHLRTGTRAAAGDGAAAADGIVQDAAPAGLVGVLDEARFRLLAEAASTLGSSLDIEQLAHSTARLSVRELADACLVFLTEEDGALTCAALAHRDPSNPVTTGDFERLLSQPGGVPFGVARLLTGDAEPPRLTFTNLGPDDFTPGAARPELLRLVRRLGVASAETLPLRVHERALGAIVLLSVTPGGLPASDLHVAELLAKRAALALENARLYHDARLAIAQREEFLSVAAHELKTPLASLQLTLETMRLSLQGDGQAQGGADGHVEAEFLRGRVRAGERQAARLGRLIHDLLDVSVIQAGRLHLHREATDLAAAVAAVVARMREDVARKQIDVTVHAPTPVVGAWDPLRLDQVITNLLSNAIKYGEERPVHVTVGGTDELAVLHVDDAGMGMSNELLARIFKPFERGVSAGHFGGLGLGLFITSQIVRAHQGTIAVRSAPGEGTSFRVELPRRATA